MGCKVTMWLAPIAGPRLNHQTIPRPSTAGSDLPTGRARGPACERSSEQSDGLHAAKELGVERDPRCGSGQLWEGQCCAAGRHPVNFAEAHSLECLATRKAHNEDHACLLRQAGLHVTDHEIPPGLIAAVPAIFNFPLFSGLPGSEFIEVSRLLLLPSVRIANQSVPSASESG
jgi:hypothetical protein